MAVEHAAIAVVAMGIAIVGGHDGVGIELVVGTRAQAMAALGLVAPFEPGIAPIG
ncbi:hypothetical protein D3C86_2224620 [compost metagenome]